MAEQLRVADLREGDVFDQAIFLSSGQRLAQPGAPLTRRQIDLLQRRGEAIVVLAHSTDDLPSPSSAAGSSGKVSGGTDEAYLQWEPAPAQASDSSSVEASCTELGDPLHSPLVRWRRRKWMRHAKVLQRQWSRASRLPGERFVAVEDSVTPGDSPAFRSVTPDDMQARRRHLAESLNQIADQVERGIAPPCSELQIIADSLVQHAATKPWVLPQLALLGDRHGGWLAWQSLAVASLATAAARQMNWPNDAIRDAALAGLVADLGMMLVPHRIRHGGCELTSLDRNLVQRHPAFAVTIARTIGLTGNRILRGIWQHHERLDGSGYPLGLREHQIDDLAALLAVVDCFVGMISPRNHRWRRYPHQAIERMIEAADHGQFHRCSADALLRVVGRHPVGSYVWLSNGMAAQVIAVYPDPSAPTLVQPIDSSGLPLGNTVELDRTSRRGLSIVRAMPCPGPDASAA